MLISETIFIKWNSRTKKYYADLGYIYTKMFDSFEVKVSDLTKGSEAIVTIQCDYCGKIHDKIYYSWVNSHKNNKLDSCECCKVTKSKDTNMQKYGVESVFSLPEIQDKNKLIIFEKYGVENVSQLNYIQEKIIENNLIKYGVTNTSKLDSYKDKVKEISRERYGVDYKMQTKEFQEQVIKTSLVKYGTERTNQNVDVKNKMRATLMKNYGVDHPMKNKEILNKSITSRYLHGSFTCSKQQYKLYETIGGELNYPFGRFVIDVAFPEEKIAVEWDGSGHNLSVRMGNKTENEFKRNESFRRKTLFDANWRIITFITKKDIFPKNIIDIYNYCLEYLKNGGHSIYVYIDENEITYKEVRININNIVNSL